MNKKIIFTLMILCVAVASVSSVSAWWIFGGGSDVTINGVDFHIPEGFDDVTQDTININTAYEAYTQTNPETHDYFSIAVYDNPNDEQNTINNLINMHYKKVDIKGKEVYYTMLVSSVNSRYDYVYLDNGKYISMEVPIWCDAGGLNSEELVNEIIK